MDNISIVMLFHNNRGTHLAIEALSEQMRPGDEFVIVNDHSDPVILEQEVAPCLSRDVRLINAAERRADLAHNRNLGAGNTTCPILLFVDGDMILCENALDILRHAYKMRDCVAFIGTEHGMKSSSLHMSLDMGDVNYQSLIQTKDGRAFLYQHPMLSDWRESELSAPQFEAYYWIYFYTSFCSVRRSAFESAGGFDEAFITWGSEDVDMGYRLSQWGKIGYLKGLEGLHIPHPRNIWKQEISDRDNIRYILDKFRVWQIELLSSFDSSCRLYDQMEKIYHEICRWNLPPVPVRTEADSLWINLPAAGREDRTTQWFDFDRAAYQAPLLGIALPFCDQRFQRAYLTANVFAYPRIITARILQESLRVSRRVYLCPASEAYRRPWEDDAFQLLTGLHHVCAVSCDPMEFDLTPREDGLIEVRSPENRARLSYAFSKAPVFPSAATRQKWSAVFARTDAVYTLVNLAGIDAEAAKEKLRNALGIKIGLCYDFQVPESEAFSLSEALPLVLCQNASPLLYVVTDIRRLQKDCAWQRNTEKDLVFDQTGTLSACAECGI